MVFPGYITAPPSFLSAPACKQVSWERGTKEKALSQTFLFLSLPYPAEQAMVPSLPHFVALLYCVRRMQTVWESEGGVGGGNCYIGGPLLLFSPSPPFEIEPPFTFVHPLSLSIQCRGLNELALPDQELMVQLYNGQASVIQSTISRTKDIIRNNN